ncbi:MAG TPA: uroporphyrinogen-III synthase [Caulobacteraceae bacterium]|jgi:uroporphyrinogen-III synthase
MARKPAAKPAFPPPCRVWITRARPGADATAARLAELRIEAVVEPLLQVRALAGADLDLTGVSALAFTSANAVAAFAERSADRSLRVFAVGDATAKAARAQRFASVLSAQGDVGALASALATRRRELAGVILYPAAAEPAQDLAGALEAVGLTVRQAALYETVTLQPPEAFVGELPQIDGVLLHSAKAARTLAAFLKLHPAPQLTAYCLSSAVARPLARAALAARRSAAAPNETSLLSLLSG